MCALPRYFLPAQTTQDPALESGLDVPSKAERIANFHRSTVHAALEIVGAMGVERPSDIRPEHLYRRESGFKAMDFAQLSKDFFPIIQQPGVLLTPPSGKEAEEERLPKRLRHWWAAGGELHMRTREL